MNTVRLCDPRAEEPFETFVEGTTTFVCLPEGSDCQLFFQVKDPGELTIESEGQEIKTETIDPSKHMIDLKSVLTVREPVRSLFPRLRSVAQTRTRKLREFKVIVKRGIGEAASVAATFDFQLLAPAEFKQAYAQHLEDCPTCPKPVYPHSFIVDWQAEQGQRCWNCRKPLAEGNNTQCTNCGADQEQEVSQS